MIIISLDEGGRFEKNERDDVTLVGGTVFRCANEFQAKRERKSLIHFFREVCKACNAEFPRDLHRTKSNEPDNSMEVFRVKTALLAALPEFLQGHGQFREGEFALSGSYELYAMVSDREGIQSLNAVGLSNLLNDSKAANRYEHMAYRTLENLLFCDLRLRGEKQVQLDLATRVTRNQAAVDAELLGMRKVGGSLVAVTEAGSYRAALASAILNSDRTDVQVRLDVMSIKYSEAELLAEMSRMGKELPDGDEVETAMENMAFLYLADTICSEYQDLTQGVDSDRLLRPLIAGSDRMVRRGNGHFWCYGELDVAYQRAFRACMANDAYSCLCELYRIHQERSDNARQYETLWMSGLLEELARRIRENEMEQAIRQLQHYCAEPRFLVEQCRFVHSALEQMLNGWETKAENLQFRLDSIGLILYNHAGNPEVAEQYYQRCLEHAQAVSVEEYLELRNCHTVTQMDHGAWEAAQNECAETLGFEELLAEMHREIYAGRELSHIHYGRTLSLMGQCCAFQNLSEAETYFIQALEQFSADPINRQITLSYFLHFLIEQKNTAEYCKWASEYFGAEQLENQLENLLKRQDTATKFGLYVYVKALYWLFAARMESATVQKLVERILSVPGEKNDHPWEMIFKYCAMLWKRWGEPDSGKKKGGKDRAAELIRQSETCLAVSAGILQEIVAAGKRQYQCVEQGKDPFAEEALTYMYR